MPLRLRWGPHAGKLAEQVLLRDPQYVTGVLDDQPEGVLASVFRDLITQFDARALACRCARCGRNADGVCAYPGTVCLIGFCERCALISAHAPPRPAVRVTTYEEALRHVAASFARGHRIEMRRIVAALALAKGGPARATEAAARGFFAA